MDDGEAGNRKGSRRDPDSPLQTAKPDQLQHIFCPTSSFCAGKVRNGACIPSPRAQQWDASAGSPSFPSPAAGSRPSPHARLSCLAVQSHVPRTLWHWMGGGRGPSPATAREPHRPRPKCPALGTLRPQRTWTQRSGSDNLKRQRTSAGLQLGRKTPCSRHDLAGWLLISNGQAPRGREGTAGLRRRNIPGAAPAPRGRLRAWLGSPAMGDAPG